MDLNFAKIYQKNNKLMASLSSSLSPVSAASPKEEDLHARSTKEVKDPTIDLTSGSTDMDMGALGLLMTKGKANSPIRTWLWKERGTPMMMISPLRI